MLKVVSVFFIALCLSVSAQDKPIKVKSGKFIYKTELSGLIMSSSVDEVKIDAKYFQNWTLEKAVSHGTSVKKGDVLASFDAKPFEDELAAKKRALEIQKANLTKSQKLFEINMKKMDFERKRSLLSAEAAKKRALIYKEKGHELAVKTVEQELVDAKNSLEYQKEELNQLKKMYDEDKITEETEEIVLKRQKNYVESLEKRLKARELAVEQALNIKLPDALFNSEYTKEKALMDEDKNRVEWEVFALTEKLKLEAEELAYKKASENFEKLKAEKKNLVIKAEKDGVVYYGKLTAGKWGNQLGTSYKKGKVFLKGSKLFSLIDAGSYNFEGKADYTQIQYVSDKASYFVQVAGAGARVLKLKEKSSAPNNGFFSVKFTIENPQGAFHGMNAKATLITDLGNVISLPSAAVKTENENPTRKFVKVLKDSQEEKVYVETGLVHGGKTVIKSGLKEGMEVKAK